MKPNLKHAQSHRRHLLASLCAWACAVAGTPASAQDDHLRTRPLAAADGATAPPIGVDDAHRSCPHPVQMTLVVPQGGGAAPSSPDAADFPLPGWGSLAGSQFNQTQTNQPFGHTFRFKPSTSACCQYSTGLLVVTYRALSPEASNDGGGPVRNHAALNNMQPQGYNHIWGNAPVATGTQVTKTYPIPAAWIASGRVSFAAQDDTAVVRATLRINGCCVTATQPER